MMGLPCCSSSRLLLGCRSRLHIQGSLDNGTWPPSDPQYSSCLSYLIEFIIGFNNNGFKKVLRTNERSHDIYTCACTMYKAIACTCNNFTVSATLFSFSVEVIMSMHDSHAVSCMMHAFNKINKSFQQCNEGTRSNLSI